MRLEPSEEADLIAGQIDEQRIRRDIGLPVDLNHVLDLGERLSGVLKRAIDDVYEELKDAENALADMRDERDSLSADNADLAERTANLEKRIAELEKVSA